MSFEQISASPAGNPSTPKPMVVDDYNFETPGPDPCDDDNLLCNETMPDINPCLSHVKKTPSCVPYDNMTPPHVQLKNVSKYAQTLYNTDPVSFFKNRLTYDASDIKIANNSQSITFPVTLSLQGGANCPSSVNAYAKVFREHDTDYENEREIYDCFAHRVDSCFFVTPICVGDIPLGSSLDTVVRNKWKKIMSAERLEKFAKDKLRIVITENCNPRASKFNDVFHLMNKGFVDIIVVQTVHALETMKLNNVCHGDLHPGNILFPESKDIGLWHTEGKLYVNAIAGSVHGTIQNADFECPRVVKIFDWDHGKVLSDSHDPRLWFLDTIAFVKTLLVGYRGPKIWDATDQLKAIINKTDYWQKYDTESKKWTRVQPHASGADRFWFHVAQEDVLKMEPEEISVVNQFLKHAYRRCISSILRGGKYVLSPFFVAREWSGDTNDFMRTFKKAYLSYVVKQKREDPTYILGYYDPGPDGLSLQSSARPYTSLHLKHFFKTMILDPEISALITPHFVVEHADWDDDEKYDAFGHAFEDALVRWKNQTGDKMTRATKHPAAGRTETLGHLIEKHDIFRTVN